MPPQQHLTYPQQLFPGPARCQSSLADFRSSARKVPLSIIQDHYVNHKRHERKNVLLARYRAHQAANYRFPQLDAGGHESIFGTIGPHGYYRT